MGIWLLCFVVFIICIILGLWIIGPAKHTKIEETQDKKDSKVIGEGKNKQQSTLKEKDDATGEQGQKASKKKKKKKDEAKQDDAAVETQVSAIAGVDDTFIGHLKTAGIVSIDIKLSKMLVSSPNKELTLFDLKSYTKDNPGNCKKGYVALEDVASAVAIGGTHYFAALQYERTIVYYEFVGQNGVYFKLVNKFKNKYLHKEPILAMQVDEKETCIVTVGNLSDTYIKVWNLKGEKLAEVNTSQVEHYQASFGENYVLLRSWTPELRLYNLIFTKDLKEFSKIQKGAELSHSDGVLAGACDWKGETAVSLRKDRTIQLWDVNVKTHHSKVKRIMDHHKFGYGQLSVCAVHSVENEEGTLNTIVAFSDGNNIVICDWENLNMLKEIKSPYGAKDTVASIKFNGKKSVVMFVTSHKQGKIMIWNVSALMSRTTTH